MQLVNKRKDFLMIYLSFYPAKVTNKFVRKHLLCHIRLRIIPLLSKNFRCNLKTLRFEYQNTVTVAEMQVYIKSK